MTDERASVISGDAAEYAHTQVRNAILHGTLAPGQDISQVQLAKQLGVSRTPLREALRMLQREGLIEAEHNRLVRIAPLSVEDVEGLYVARVTLEAIAIRIAVPLMTAREVAVAQGRLAEMEHLVNANEYEGWESTHRTFHAGLVVHSGVRICTLLEEMSSHAERYRRAVATQAPRAWSTGSEEHRRIVDACAAGDGEAAAAELARHLARTGFTFIALMNPAHEARALRTALAAATGDPVTPAADPR